MRRCWWEDDSWSTGALRLRTVCFHLFFIPLQTFVCASRLETAFWRALTDIKMTHFSSLDLFSPTKRKNFRQPCTDFGHVMKQKFCRQNPRAVRAAAQRRNENSQNTDHISHCSEFLRFYLTLCSKTVSTPGKYKKGQRRSERYQLSESYPSEHLCVCVLCLHRLLKKTAQGKLGYFFDRLCWLT